MIPFINFLLFALMLSSAMSVIEDAHYCAFDLTIAIDFSHAMENQANIDNLTHFVLHNFTNNLPFFGTSLLKVALLTFGINGITSISQYYDHYDNFAKEVYIKYNESKQYPILKPVNLSDVFESYLKFIQDHPRKDIPAKLVLFTAIIDDTNIHQANNISKQIRSISKPECLTGSIGIPCTKIITVGVNKNSSNALYDLGNWAYYNNFEDYTHDIIENVCTMAINAPPHKCGDGYCEESICTGNKNGCYYYGTCIQGQCIYWDMSVKYWQNAKTSCHEAGASLVSIPNQEFQDEIYNFMGDLEYWTGLNSLDSCSGLIWAWDELNGGLLPLSKTNYSNWHSGKPNSSGDCSNSCVKDRNASIDDHGWKVANCSGDWEYFLCMKETTIPTSKKFPIYLIIIIVIAVLISVALLASFLYYRFIYWRKKQQGLLKDRNSESALGLSSSPESLSTRCTSLGTTELSILNISSGGNMTIEESEFNQFENVNIISFPQNEKIYTFNITDFVEKSCIEATTRHLVQKYKHKPSGEFMAVKQLIIPRSQHYDETTQLSFRKLLTEIENFRKLWQHPNIVNFYGICVYEGQALICMELMDLSLKHLYKHVHSAKENIPEKFVGYVAVKMVDAMMFCKSNEIIHRDIKPSNVLVNYSGEIKLCDFGESRLLDNSLASTHVGTVAYWPPERLLDADSKYDIRTDIWSLGITLMEIILGRLPYLSEIPETNLTANENIDNIEEQRSAQFFILNSATTSMLYEMIKRDICRRYSDELCEFLSSCLQKVDRRPKLDALTKCLFYTNNNSDEIFNISKEFILKVKVIVKNFL